MADKPHLDSGGLLLANAYALISRSRPGGFGLSAIPPAAIWEWLDRNSVADRFVRKHFEDVMIAVDNITLRRASKKASASPPKPEAPKPSKPAKSSASGRRRRIAP